MTDIGQRKEDHIDLAVSGDVAFKRTTTLFEGVRLVHDALPELDLDAIDLSACVLGRTLKAPLLIAAMTGGTDRARRINLQLAELAEKRGYALGFGSQRAMLKNPAAVTSYQVREVAPSALLLGNLGVVQAREMSVQQVADMVAAIDANALCVHLNPAMEVVQPGGDRDFRGCLDVLGKLAAELDVPVIAKETGCGISRQVGQRLRQVGLQHLDVSGAGGTSWVAVETQRASGALRGLGEAYWEWGIPTAASVALNADLGFDTIFATGGMKTGLDVAKAICLGASAAGLARPVLQALEGRGPTGAEALLDQVEQELRTAMLLTGSGDVSALRRAPRLIRGELRHWLEQQSH